MQGEMREARATIREREEECGRLGTELRRAEREAEGREGEIVRVKGEVEALRAKVERGDAERLALEGENRVAMGKVKTREAECEALKGENADAVGRIGENQRGDGRERSPVIHYFMRVHCVCVVCHVESVEPSVCKLIYVVINPSLLTRLSSLFLLFL